MALPQAARFVRFWSLIRRAFFSIAAAEMGFTRIHSQFWLPLSAKVVPSPA